MNVDASVPYARDVSGRQPSTHSTTPATTPPADLPASADPPAVTDAVEADHTVDAASAAASLAATAAEIDHELTSPAPRGLAGLYARFRHILHELGKFGTVGSVAFLVDLAIFNGLRLIVGVETLISATISMVVAATVAFIGNRYWTWRDRERSGLRREYTLYFIFNVVGLLIALTCLAINTYGLGSMWAVFKTPLAENVAKNVVGLALGTTFRFWSYRTIVFRTGG
jgi:putative flippase GtrA